MSEDENRPPKPPTPSDGERQNAIRSDGDHPVVPNGAPVPSPNMGDARDLKKAQTLVMVASIAGPVSLFIGGVLLSTVGLVCGIMAYRKLRALAAKHADIATMAVRLKRSSIVGMAVCGIALALNAVSAYLMFPVMLEMMETGEYAGFVADAGSGAIGPNSTWG